MHKITYEYKGVKVTIEADYTISDVEVAEALLISQEKLPKVFSKTNLNKLVEYQDVIPTVLTPKDISEILRISQKTTYDLIKKAIDTEMFTAMKIHKVYRISKKSFLTWLLGYECADLSDASFKVFTSDEIQEILSISSKTTYEILNQASINKWFEVKKIGRDYKIPAVPFLIWMDGLESIEKRFK
ncbi:helix-turn-helix domain-containing protein [Romboutsia ilealis]|uniref:helix-turn-helix domain-containing protein n=2 Tax=Romboutsia ilealis TaxID=1115758 RepID=UPI00259CFB1A|nr:helix-turn-helix domain-containing protein [Romboutsia ilealis]